MNMVKTLILSAILFFSLQPTISAAEQAGVTLDVDYPAFLSRQDLTYDQLPAQFDHGGFLGNGLLGSTVYQTGNDTIRFEMGRTDVVERRRDNNRIPIGGLVLKTVG